MKKKNEYSNFIENGVKYMQCQSCLSEYVEVGGGVTAVTCNRCTNIIMINKFPDSIPKYNIRKSNGKPPGWHFMNEFVDKDGNVFHRGKEQPKLKGTLKPTKVKPPKKRKVKRRTKEEILAAQYRDKKKKLREARKKQEDFLNHKFDDE